MAGKDTGSKTSKVRVLKNQDSIGELEDNFDYLLENDIYLDEITQFEETSLESGNDTNYLSSSFDGEDSGLGPVRSTIKDPFMSMASSSEEEFSLPDEPMDSLEDEDFAYTGDDDNFSDKHPVKEYEIPFDIDKSDENEIAKANELEELGLESDSRSSFWDSSGDDDSIALSSDELGEIQTEELDEDGEFALDDEIPEFDDSEEVTDDEITLSSNELDNILQSSEDEDIEVGEGKSFFDGADSEDESITLSSDELENINISSEDSDTEDDVTLSGEELNNILDDSDEAKSNSFFDSEEELDESKSFFDSDDELDESITLSPDELSNIDLDETEELSEDTEDDITLSKEELGNILEDESEEKSSFFDSEPEDESITLSEDELSNITSEEEDDEINGSSFFEESLEDENITLSPDELNDIAQEEPEEVPGFFDSEVEDESIALSDDELNNITAENELETEEVGNVFDSSDEDESITLSNDELNNISAEEEPVESVFDGEDQDESIALSSDELDNILKTGGENLEKEIGFTEDSGVFDDSEESNISLSSDELDNILNTGEFDEVDANDQRETHEVPVVEDIRSESIVEDDYAKQSSKGNFNFGNVKHEELKKVMSYVDELLGELPDEIINEFAQSEYFDLYKKVMKELDI